MVAGDLKASAPVVVTMDGLKAAIDVLNLAAATDVLHVVPCNNGHFVVFKVLRATA